MQDPDEDLIPLLVRGDERAFGALIERHVDTIQALATHMLGDVFLAEDVTQTVFLKTWQIAPTWKPGQAKLITWMRRVATNQCLDRLRKKSPTLMDVLPERIDESPQAFDHVVQGEQAATVKAAIAALPERQRAALILTYYQNVSQIEGAEILEVSVSAYESLLSRARRALKASLMPERGRLLDRGVE